MAKFQKPKLSGTRVLVYGRLSYAHLWEPRAASPDQPKKYSTVVLISKEDKETLAAIKKAYEAAKEEGLSTKWGGKIPKGFRNPIKDGDAVDESGARECGDAYEGCFYFNANSKTPPGIIDTYRNDITDQSKVYSGCYAMVSVNFYPYNVDRTSSGVGVGLNNVMKVADGPSLGGGPRTAADDFADIELDLDMDLDSGVDSL